MFKYEIFPVLINVFTNNFTKLNSILRVIDSSTKEIQYTDGKYYKLNKSSFKDNIVSYSIYIGGN